MRTTAFVTGLVLLVGGATVALIGVAQFFALEQHRLPGGTSLGSWLTGEHVDPRHFKPEVRYQVRRATWMGLAGAAVAFLGLLLLAAARW